MTISHEEYQKLQQGVLDITEQGPITEWTERMAQLAKELGLPVHQMPWSNTPFVVASEVVQYADQRDLIAQLNKKIDEATG